MVGEDVFAALQAVLLPQLFGDAGEHVIALAILSLFLFVSFVVLAMLSCSSSLPSLRSMRYNSQSISREARH